VVDAVFIQPFTGLVAQNDSIKNHRGPAAFFTGSF
jgi:hypothetical protein